MRADGICVLDPVEGTAPDSTAASLDRQSRQGNAQVQQNVRTRNAGARVPQGNRLLRQSPQVLPAGRPRGEGPAARNLPHSGRTRPVPRKSKKARGDWTGALFALHEVVYVGTGAALQQLRHKCRPAPATVRRPDAMHQPGRLPGWLQGGNVWIVRPNSRLAGSGTNMSGGTKL